MTRTTALATPSLGPLCSLLQQPRPLFTTRPEPSLSLHTRPASALARLASPRLASPRLGPPRPGHLCHTVTSHPSAPCLSPHSAVILTRSWPASARIPHRAVHGPVRSRHGPARPARRVLFAHVSPNVLYAACALVQQSGPHSGPPYPMIGLARPCQAPRIACSLMCMFAHSCVRLLKLCFHIMDCASPPSSVCGARTAG